MVKSIQRTLGWSAFRYVCTIQNISVDGNLIGNSYNDNRRMAMPLNDGQFTVIYHGRSEC